MSDTSRLFFAIWPDDIVRQRLALLTQSFHREYGGRAMAADSLHVTLAFLGDTPNTRLADLDHIGQSIATPSFTLRLDIAGCWQRGIFWLGPTDTPSALSLLAASLHKKLKSAEILFDDSKRFAPHMTLLRKAEAPRGWQSDIEPVEFAVNDFVLVRSASATSGVRYEPIARFPLSAT